MTRDDQPTAAQGPGRDALLQSAWEAIRGWTPENVGNVPAAARAVAAGADPGDVATALTAAGYEAVFALVEALDVSEVFPDEELQGLHEDLLSADPTGREGEDFFS